MSIQTLTLTQPDDWHVHLRDGAMLSVVVKDTAQRFARAIVMPNLKLPITTTQQALAYRQRILQSLPQGVTFEPLMTLYLTDRTSPEEIKKAKASGYVVAVKYYPAGATTHSDEGVTDIKKCEAVLAAMQEQDLPLLIHGEVTDPKVDMFDREKVFIEKILQPLVQRFSKLRVVLEHITTREAVEFVLSAPKTVAATLTAHHLLLNRNALFEGGIRPHYYCLPILKRENHRQALIEAAISGNPKFFLGSDSAPHAQHNKETACGCAGIYTAHAGIELYAEVFSTVNKLDRLEAFASFHGADFYQLPRNKTRVQLVQKNWISPHELLIGEDKLIPFRAGEMITWKINHD